MDDITYDDLSPECRDIADEIGLPATLRLLRLLEGQIVYFRTLDSVRRAVRNRHMRKTFTGDYRATADRYGLSASRVRKIIDGKG